MHEYNSITICPACTSIQGQPIGDPASAFEAVAGGQIFRHPEYQIIRCNDCSLHYKSRVCGSAALSDYYSKLEFESYEDSNLFPTDTEVIRILDTLPDRAMVLDFGCGIGRILASSAKRITCYGVEVNDRAASVASERGITIQTEDEVFSDSEPRFDAIILTDVYEHLATPIELLSNLSKLLNPGGKLMLVTGNADAIPGNCFSSEFWYYRILGHLHMASVMHLHWLSKRLNLLLGDIIYTGHYSWPFFMRMKQVVQRRTYTLFRTRPHSFTAQFVALLPVLRRARYWESAPSDSSECDHFVVVYIKKLHDK